MQDLVALFGMRLKLDQPSELDHLLESEIAVNEVGAACIALSKASSRRCRNSVVHPAKSYETSSFALRFIYLYCGSRG